jgi:hypothetical protein
MDGKKLPVDLTGYPVHPLDTVSCDKVFFFAEDLFIQILKKILRIVDVR